MKHKLTLVLVLLALVVIPGCVNGQYQGPPVTFGGTYTTPNGATVGGNIRLDPSFAKQKK